MKRKHYDGFMYLGDISNIVLDTIASQPVRICFCSYLGLPDCSYHPPTKLVKKGETFTVSVVAVDQANHTVASRIINSLSSPSRGFGVGQQTQSVGKYCTDLTFNVFSPLESEMVHIYPDGPCESAALSTVQVIVRFLEHSSELRVHL